MNPPIIRGTARIDARLNFLHSGSKIRVRKTLRPRFSTRSGAGMLVLSRRRDERIVINDNIVITVVDIRGDKVRLGIEAPVEMSVHRQEIYEALQRERGQAEPKSPPAAT
jgi:carbon storage regulator